MLAYIQHYHDCVPTRFQHYISIARRTRRVPTVVSGSPKRLSRVSTVNEIFDFDHIRAFQRFQVPWKSRRRGFKDPRGPWRQSDPRVS
eukprot:7983628-Pyramimonas_sp.AAC.1